MGTSVTNRIKYVKQPRGGYINPKNMTEIVLGDGVEALNPDEVVSPGTVGTAVDYLTRFMLGTPAVEAFKISLYGASIAGETERAKTLVRGIKGLDYESVINAVRLCRYDVYFRTNIPEYMPVEDKPVDSATVENIITMVNRALHFFDMYGPVVLDGFTFEGGYTYIVSTGDGDFTTKDTLWDFKVSKSPVKKEHTLQLLMYWRMGLHSIYPEFKKIKYLGIYNPRLNIVSRISVNDIPQSVIDEVETEVIGYTKHNR